MHADGRRAHLIDLAEVERRHSVCAPPARADTDVFFRLTPLCQPGPCPRRHPYDSAMGPVRVMVVDDHRMVADGLATVIGADTALDVVGCAASGAEALAMAQAFPTLPSSTCASPTSAVSSWCGGSAPSCPPLPPC